MDGFGGQSSSGFEVGDLGQGMHPTVGAAGGVAMDFALEDPFDFFFEMVLDGAQAWRLGLPAAEGGAVVFQGEFEFAH